MVKSGFNSLTCKPRKTDRVRIRPRMSQIPTPGSRLKAPSKIVKPIQGGGGPSVGTTTSSAVKPRGATPKAATPSGQSKTVAPRGSFSTSNSESSPLAVKRGSVAVSGSEKVKTRSPTPGSVQPRVQREGSQSRISYSRESSSSSLRSGGSGTQLGIRRESSLTAIRRRGSEATSTPASDSTQNFKIGDRVLVSGTKPGVLAYVGEPQFAKGKWAGVILDEIIGKNDGSVAGVRYFTCEALRGIFTKLEKLTRLPGAVSPEKSVSSGKEITSPKQSHGLKVGDRVIVSGTKTGTLKYLGQTDFAKGEWAGIELDDPLGKNDGAVAGKRYFSCQANYGLFAPPHKITKAIKQPKPASATVAAQLPTPALTPQLLPAGPQQLLQDELQNSAGALGSNSSVSSLGSTHSNTSLSFKPTVKPQAVSTPDEETPNDVEKVPRKSSQISSAVVALQEALQDRESQIKVLLEEREFERTEVANASSHVAKAEKELFDLKEQHHQILLENQKSVAALQKLVETAEKEKAELQAQLDDERKRVEDLQFQLEEEEITLGDELQTEQSEIKALTKEVREKSAELQKAQADAREARAKVVSLEASFAQSTEELTEMRRSLVENEDKVKELEQKLSSAQQEHSSNASNSDQELRDKLTKISALEVELDDLRKKHLDIEKERDSNKAEVKKSKDDNMSLKETVADLSSKLHIKEDEFEHLSRELEAIKMATLELQKQLNLSETRSEHLSADKTKLEVELSELMKNSGDNSHKLSYLTDQLREKERTMDDLKNSSAEARIQIDKLTEDLAQSKKSHNEELKNVEEKHRTTVETLESKISETVQQSKQKERELAKTQETNLKELRQRNEKELSIFQNQMKKKMEDVNLLVKELDTLKQKQQQTAQERDSLKEQCSKLQTDASENASKVAKLFAELEGVQTEKELLVGSHGDTEKQFKDMVEKLKVLSEEKQKLAISKTETAKNSQEVEKQLKHVSEERNELFKEKQNVQRELENTKSNLGSMQSEVEDLKLTAAKKEEDLQKLKSSLADDLKKVNEEKSSLLQEKQHAENEVGNLKSSLVAVQEQVENLISVTAEKEEELKQIKACATDELSELADLKKEMKSVITEKETMYENMAALEQQRDTLQQHVEKLKKETITVTNDKSKVEQSLSEAQKQVQQLQDELQQSKVRENNAKVAAESERQVKDSDLNISRSLAKQKEEDVAKYKLEVESLRKQLSSAGRQSVSTTDTSGNVGRLQELQDLLAATREERDGSIAQVDFLNSVIVDLKKKNEEAERKIELLVTGEDFSSNGLLEPADDEPLKPGFKRRLFCDICDMFDLHDTDDCPAQASSPDDNGTQYHGSRTEQRPYCDICEAFGHWTQDCDDEETF